VSQDYVARIPHRFFDALESGEISYRQFLLGAWFVKTANFKTNQVALTFTSVVAGHAWRPSDQTITRDLEGLRPEWLDYEVRQGQRRTIFRLTGLCQLGQQLPQDIPKTAPDLGKLHPDLGKPIQSATPQAERGSAPEPPPTCGSPKRLGPTMRLLPSLSLREIAALAPHKPRLQRRL
jgi:hypothetical protein